MRLNLNSIGYLTSFIICLCCSSVMAQESVNPEPVSEPVTTAPVKSDLPDEMVQYFEELSRNISIHEGQCEEMTKALSDWHHAHEAWINALDFATVSADAKTVEKVRVMAESLGKQLAACYDSEEIPMLLMKYSGY